MRLAIADPPYFGSAERWYGNGRGHSGGRGRADFHADASLWDTPEQHRHLVRQLERDFDGWVLAGNLASLQMYLDEAPGARVLVWNRGNAVPSGSRVATQWEPVIARVPEGRSAHGTGLPVSDVLTAGIDTHMRFAGAKPPRWTRWVLDVLGYDPGADELVDMFEGSGAVAAAADGMLALTSNSAVDGSGS